MNPNKNIRLHQPGLYSFSHERDITAEIDRELLITFYSATSKMVGVVIHPANGHLTELLEKLEVITKKLAARGLEAKLFGLSHGPEVIAAQAAHWLRDHKINVVASDTGRALPRVLLIKPDTGQVGVRYSRGSEETEHGFLSTGSARQRNPLDAVHSEVLVLTTNPVWRILAKQAIEEQKSWGAATPKDPLEMTNGKVPSAFPWSVVLLFSDLENEPNTPEFIATLLEKYPSVQIRWVGPALPSFAKQIPALKLVPPLDPILLPEFKNRIRSAIFDHEIADTSDLIRFPKKRKKR